MHTYEVIVGNRSTGYVRRKLFSRKGMECARKNAYKYADTWRMKGRGPDGKVKYSVEVYHQQKREAA